MALVKVFVRYLRNMHMRKYTILKLPYFFVIRLFIDRNILYLTVINKSLLQISNEQSRKFYSWKMQMFSKFLLFKYVKFSVFGLPDI